MQTYQQPLDITVGENERVFFLVSGTHTIHLTGNYVITEDDEDDSEDDSEDGDYDLPPGMEDVMDDSDVSDELDGIERIEEIEEDELEAPALVAASTKKGKKRPAEEAEGLDELIAKDETKLSKKQLKKLKNNKGEAVASEKDTTPKSDKKVQFAKELEQGPTGPAKDKKFIQKLMKQLKDGSRELFVVDDKLGTPTYTIDFARNVQLLLDRRFWGIYNLICDGVTSRLEVASYLVQALGLEQQVKITPVGSDHFAQEYFAARPASERLIPTKLKLRGLYTMRDWRACLDEYLARRNAGYVERA